MLPTISTRTCSHAGAVKPSLNGCIHSASLAGTSRLELPSLITPPNRRPGRLARSRSAANPALDHIGFNASQAENGQSPAEGQTPYVDYGCGRTSTCRRELESSPAASSAKGARECCRSGIRPNIPCDGSRDWLSKGQRAAPHVAATSGLVSPGGRNCARQQMGAGRRTCHVLTTCQTPSS